MVTSTANKEVKSKVIPDPVEKQDQKTDSDDVKKAPPTLAELNKVARENFSKIRKAEKGS